jgi:hypothetical protein
VLSLEHDAVCLMREVVMRLARGPGSSACESEHVLEMREWKLHASSWSIMVGVARVAMVVAASSAGLARDAIQVSAVSGPLACVQRAR